MTDASDTQAGALPTEAFSGGGGRRRTWILFGGLLGLIAVGVLVALLLSSGDGSSQIGPANYRVEIYNGWPQLESHKRVEGFVESAWHDPAYPDVIITIDTRASDETASPLASAQLTRIQTTKLSGYHERGMRWIRMGGRPAVRWAFNVSHRAYIRYFFEECGISFLVRGTMGLIGFSALSGSVRTMAATIKTACSEQRA